MLRDYQKDICSRTVEALKRHRSVMVQMPTGTGKTVVLASLVNEELRNVSSTKSMKSEELRNLRSQSVCNTILIVAHRRELVEQIKDTIRRLGIDDGNIMVESIQTISRRIENLEFTPSLVVIDEAHHAVAATYKKMWDRWQEARFLGFTATPCRLKKQGFTDLFEVLLQSWSMNRFIAEGWLSLYDYMSIAPNSRDQQIVNGLRKRGADGDYSMREMSEKLDVMPSIERLCDTVTRYAAGKKGIVYAINITHAEHIAEHYVKNGISAAVISSKSPAEERKRLLADFKNGGTDVLVNVDLFGEGFDCPDVEFIQLARPTLSLSKYMQQVGRGMRVFNGKKFCLILDNVGLYRLFGLPSEDRDWLAMFEGRTAGKGHAETTVSTVAMNVHTYSDRRTATCDNRTQMIMIITHEGQRSSLDTAFGYRLTAGDDGKTGVADKDGNIVLSCIYNNVELKSYGFAKLYSRRSADRKQPWIDLVNGVRFGSEPRTARHGALEFSTSDGFKLYPRVKTRMMKDTDYVTSETLSRNGDGALRFRNFLIQPSEPQKLYIYRDKMDCTLLFEDEQGERFIQKYPQQPLHPINTEDWNMQKARWQQYVDDFNSRRATRLNRNNDFKDVGYVAGLSLNDYELPVNIKVKQITKNSYSIYRTAWYDQFKWLNISDWKYVSPPAYGLMVAKNYHGNYQLLNENGEEIPNLKRQFDFAELTEGGFLHAIESGREYWVNLSSHVIFTHRPELVKIGHMEFWKDGDFYYIRDSRLNGSYPYRRGEIREGNGICFVGTNYVFVEKCSIVFKIEQRYVDGRRFVVRHHTHGIDMNCFSDLYYDGVHPPKLKQHRG